jgi:hypothetical protein
MRTKLIDNHEPNSFQTLIAAKSSLRWEAWLGSDQYEVWFQNGKLYLCHTWGIGGPGIDHCIEEFDRTAFLGGERHDFLRKIFGKRRLREMIEAATKPEET